MYVQSQEINDNVGAPNLGARERSGNPGGGGCGSFLFG